jgi:hypothetical protein
LKRSEFLHGASGNIEIRSLMRDSGNGHGNGGWRNGLN